MSSASKTLGSVMKFTGRYSFLFLVVGLILFATTLTLADPSINEQTIGAGETFEYEFEVAERQDIVLFISGVEGDEIDIVITKLTFQNNNESYFFPQGPDDNVTTTEILSSAGRDFFRILDLDRGVYHINVTNLESSSSPVVIGFAYFNLGLIVATTIMMIIFFLMVSIFFTVLPFWLFAVILNSVNESNKNLAHAQQQPVNQPSQESTVSSSTPKRSGAMLSTTPTIIEGTRLEALTKKDWAWVVIAFLFFIGYISEPFDGGPALAFMIIILLSVTYNVTEREKNKNRILILLRAYPKSSIAFIAEQLDKKEDYIVDVLRIMILDEGQPIRLDLVNRTVNKVGPFTGETTAKSAPIDHSGPDTAAQSAQTTQTAEATQESVEDNVQNTADQGAETTEQTQQSDVDDSQIRHGDRGTVTEPWAYCQQCGEGLKSKVKYCYVCGARQYK